jgi:hypothetical protein
MTTKAHHLLTPLLALLGALVAVLALTAVPALAAGPVSFGSPGSSVAVDNSTSLLDPAHGNVYVTTGQGHQGGFTEGEVDEFDSSGTFLRAFDVADPTAVAVDQSAGPSAGDVYVADNSSTVEKFSPAGKLELTFGSPGTGPGQFSSAYGREIPQFARLPLAVDASGNVWVGDRNRIEEFNEKGEYLNNEVEVPDFGLVQGLAIDIDPSSPSVGDFYVSGNRPQPGQQAVQPPGSGSFTLSFEGQSTASLPFNATPAEVQAALEALSTIGAGNVIVREGVNGGQELALLVEFTGALGHTALPSLGVSAGRVEVEAEGAPGGLLKLKSDGTKVGSIDTSGEPRAFGVDPATGDLFVVDTPPNPYIGGVQEENSEHTLLEFSASGAELERFGAGEVLGTGNYPVGNALAFGDVSGALYVTSYGHDGGSQIFTPPPPGPLVQVHSAKATGVGKTAATLNATVNPEDKATTVHFQFIAEQQFKQDGETFGAGTVITPESGSIGADFSEYPVSAAATGLRFETAYRFRVVATSKCEKNPVTEPHVISTCEIQGEDATFTTLPPLRVDSTSVAAVTATSVTLNAQVDPLGEAASYRFEYLSEAAFVANGDSFSGSEPAVSVPQPNAALGSGEVDAEAVQHVQDLSPSTVYRYRVVGFDAVATEGIDGPALSFTTQGAGGSLVLADGRQWELVSPADNGAELLPIVSYAAGTEAASSGDAMAYVATASTGAEPVGNSNFSQVLSSRGAGGWSSRDLAIPHSAGTAFSASSLEYRGVFSSDLSLSVVQPLGAFDPSLSGEASEQTGYLRTDYLNGESSDFCTSSCYRPLVTGAEGFANVREGVEFGGNSQDGIKCPPGILCGPQIFAASPDLRHIVFTSDVPLTSTPGDTGHLYEWSEGQIHYIGEGGPGQGAQQSVIQAVVDPRFDRNAISADGSRVFFTEDQFTSGSGVIYPEEGEGPLKVRDVTTEETLRISPGEGLFQGASSDGSRVFYTEAGGLFECALSEVAGKLQCTTVELAAGVQGVIGASEDGSSVYFVSDDALAAGGALGTCGTAAGTPTKIEEEEVTETCGLYVYHAGQTAFIATLSGKDAPDWRSSQEAEGGTPGQFLYKLTARVSPNGRWLAFMSQRSLTGYDNTDATSAAACGAEKGICDEEVYLYHAPAAGGAGGALVCPSCNPTGARPHGVEYEHLSTAESGLVGGNQVWKGSQWLAANVPGWTSTYHQSRYLSNEGRLFFNSSDALVPQDVNGTEDVYEYEPPVGAGGGSQSSPEAPSGDTCTTGSSTYSPRSEGCVSLVSSGASPEQSAFLDASESGDDVFFLSSGELTSQSRGGLSVFDAHACSSASPCPPPEPAKPVECQGDACQSPYVAPENPAQVLQGPPTVAALTPPPPPVKKVTKKTVKCKKGFAKNKKGQCVKKKSKKKAKKAKRATNDRRTKS